MDFLVGIEALGSFQENLLRFRVHGVGNATIVNRTNCGTLWLVEMPDALRAALMGDHIDTVTDTQSIPYMVPLGLGIAARLKNRLVGTFWLILSKARKLSD
jgi:hypothetical protein